MEDAVYHFQSKNINLVNSKVNSGDCAPFADRESDPNESICKTLISQNEFQTIDHSNFNGAAAYPVLNARRNENEEDLNLIITSSTTLNQNISLSNKESENEFDECKNLERNTFKESQSSAEVKSKPDAPVRGGVQLVRLQAVTGPGQSTNGGCEGESQNSHAISIASQEQMFENKIQDIADNQQQAYSEPDYQFLTPRAPNVSPQQGFASENPGGSFQLDDTDFQSLMQSENMSEDTSTTSGASNVANRLRSQTSTGIKTPIWISNPSSSHDNVADDSLHPNSGSSLQYVQDLPESVSSNYQNPTSASETPDPQQMQRFYTADNQVVYGYKDPQGEFHFFCPALSNRESHNEKERKRRSRVAEACSTLRKLVPGLSDKTDKATVFEKAAAYLKFLREKFASQFDQSYCEKYFQERS